MDNKDYINEQNEELDFKQLLVYFIRYWKWFALSVFLSLCIAVIYIKCKTKVYQITAKVLIKDNEKGTFNSQTDVLADFGFQGTNTNVENEIEVINSKSVVQMAVMHSGLYIKYVNDGTFVSKPIYKLSCPILVSVNEESLGMLMSALRLKFELNSDSVYEVSYQYTNEAEDIDVESTPQRITSFPYVLNTVKGEVVLLKNDTGVALNEYSATIYPPATVAASYKGALAVSPISKTASVAIIAVHDAVPMNGVDFINSLIISYNRQSDEDKNILARKTEEFIGTRIEVIGKDLRVKEENLANYKKNNQLINPTIDAPSVLQSRSEYLKKLDEVNMQLEQSDHLLKYIGNPENEMQAIPTVLGLSNEPTLSALITRYNTEVARRNQLLHTATEENPTLVAVTENIKITQRDIINALVTVQESFKVRKKTIEQLADKYSARAAATPAIERIYTDLTRERDIKSQLYVMLLQKYEENALTLAVTADNLKCIDAASVNAAPIAPRKTLVLALALLFGIALPATSIYLIQILHTKIKSVEELESLTSLPILGCVPLQKEFYDIIPTIGVKKDVNDIVAESYRTIRTNLGFIMPKGGKVIMFTSTTSGEGKTFVSSNFAVSQAFLGKKVLLVGLDIRCPRLAEVFGIKNKYGVTTFLLQDNDNYGLLEESIVASQIVDNLDILPAGIVPPNPAELLAKDNLDKAIEYLSAKYDYIILDTSPVGLVTDSIIVSRVANVILYIARANYTEKTDLEFITSLIKDKKLNNVALILNAEDFDKQTSLSNLHSKHRYGHSYYGAGYGDYNNEVNNKKV